MNNTQCRFPRVLSPNLIEIPKFTKPQNLAAFMNGASDVYFIPQPHPRDFELRFAGLVSEALASPCIESKRGEARIMIASLSKNAFSSLSINPRSAWIEVPYEA